MTIATKMIWLGGGNGAGGCSQIETLFTNLVEMVFLKKFKIKINFFNVFKLFNMLI